MAPVPVTEDYYFILAVEQNATLEEITQAYRRLARKLHPDRNDRTDATEAFQALGNAYEVLKDECKRRDYDRLYPSISKARGQAQNNVTHTQAVSEVAQIVALQKSKQDRAARWAIKKKALDFEIEQHEIGVQQYKKDIKNLENTVKAEAARESWRNSWGAWLLSPMYKQKEESEEEEARKDRERQELRIQIDMKERLLASLEENLKKKQDDLRIAKKEIEAADAAVDAKIQKIHEAIKNRELRERQQRERVERERLAKFYQEQRERERQRQEQVRLEAERRRQEEIRAAAEKKRQEEEERKLFELFKEERKRKHSHNKSQTYNYPNRNNPDTISRSLCDHGGWWPKIQGRMACPECSEVWTYLLKCPGCTMLACPKCQSSIRPRRQRYTAPPRNKSPSPVPYFNDWYD